MGIEGLKETFKEELEHLYKGLNFILTLYNIDFKKLEMRKRKKEVFGIFINFWS